MGSVLRAKMVVEITPAMTGTFISIAPSPDLFIISIANRIREKECEDMPEKGYIDGVFID